MKYHSYTILKGKGSLGMSVWIFSNLNLVYNITGYSYRYTLIVSMYMSISADEEDVQFSPSHF